MNTSYPTLKHNVLTAGQEVVLRARAGGHGSGDFHLTPADCQHILDHCDFVMPVKPGDAKKNREVKPARVNAYEKSILAKGVLDTGDTLKFDTNGNMFDGRHRLTTAIKIGVDFPTLVAFGRDPASFTVVDSAVSVRSRREIFEMAEIVNANNMTGLTDRLMSWRGDYFGNSRSKRSGEELLDYYRDHMDGELAADCLKLADRAYKASKVFALPTAALLYVLRALGDADRALEFADKLIDGPWGKKGRAVGVLVAVTNSFKSNPQFEVTATFRQALIVETWNKFAQNLSGNQKALMKTPLNVKVDLTVKK